MSTSAPLYQMQLINSKNLTIPNKYQHPQHRKQIDAIVANFDERIANEPKVSFRNGRYNVFDGQHTVMARVKRNGNQHLDILCKVYYGLTLQDEAKLFAEQFGESHTLTGGEEIKALLVANHPKAWAFKNATESCGLYLDLDGSKGKHHVSCVKTAFSAYKKIGEERYKEALGIIVAAWDGEPESLMVEPIKALTEFVRIYHGTYDYKHLVLCLRAVHPRQIVNTVKADVINPGNKKYIYPIFNLYNDSGDADELLLKF